MTDGIEGAPLEPFALYRWYDAGKRLLYIGKTGELAQRVSGHVARSRWMQLAASSTVERHKTAEDVGRAEREAIETEQPLFNKQYNDTPEAKERLRTYLTGIDRLDLLYPKSRMTYREHVLSREAPERLALEEDSEEPYVEPVREGCGASHSMAEMLGCPQCRDDFLVAAIPPYGDGIASIAERAREGRACSPDWSAVHGMVFGYCHWCNPLWIDSRPAERLTCHDCGVELELHYHEWFGEDVYMIKYGPRDGTAHLRNCRGRMIGGHHCGHEDTR